MIIAIHLFAAIERVDDLEAMKAFGRKKSFLHHWCDPDSPSGRR